MTKELYSKNWDFAVYQVNDRLVISVVFFGVVDYFRSFYIPQHEFNGVYEDLKSLSGKIRTNYEDFRDLEIMPAITMEDLS